MTASPGNTNGDLFQALAAAAAELFRIASALSGQDPAILQSLPSPARGPHSKTLASVVNELVEAKARAGRSDGYLTQIHFHLSDLARGREQAPLASLTAADVEKWAYSGGKAAATIKGRLNCAGLLFHFAIKRGYCQANPAAGIDQPTRKNDPPGIHTPAEVRRVLAEARRQHAGVARHLALRYFAGLRASEADALPPEAVNLAAGRLEVSARISKTRTRRLVTIQPNLASWLALASESPGDMFKRVKRVARAAGVPWPANAPPAQLCLVSPGPMAKRLQDGLGGGAHGASPFPQLQGACDARGGRGFLGNRPVSPPGVNRYR